MIATELKLLSVTPNMQYKIIEFTPAVFGSDGLYGGAERYVASLAQGINQNESANCNATVVGFGARTSVSECKGVRTHTIGVDPGVLSSASGSAAELYELFAEADLIHIHQMFSRAGQLAALTSLQLNKPFVLTDHGGGDDLDVPCLDALRQAAAGVYVSQVSKSHCEELLKLQRTKIFIGPVDDKFFKNGNSFRGRAVLFTGRILPHKGVDRIICNLPSNLPLTIAGAMQDERFYNDLVKLAAGKKVNFILDPDDDTLITLYQTHNVYCIASTHHDRYGRRHKKPELMGITTMEALASGCAVLVAKTGALPEVIEGASPDFARVFASDDELNSLLGDIASGLWPHDNACHVSAATFAEKFRKRSLGTMMVDLYKSILSAGDA